MPSPQLTTTEAAELLGVHPDTLRGWADEGKIPVWRTPGGQRRFQRSDLENMLRRPAKPAGEVAS